MGDQYKTTLAFVDPAFLDGAITDDHLRQNVAGAKRIAESAIEADQDDQVESAFLRDDVDPDEAERNRKADSVVDRIISEHRVRADDPAFAERAATRNALVDAQRALTDAAVGENQKGDAFIEPESDATYRPAPKPATGFAVVKKGRRGR